MKVIILLELRWSGGFNLLLIGCHKATCNSSKMIHVTNSYDLWLLEMAPQLKLATESPKV